MAKYATAQTGGDHSDHSEASAAGSPTAYHSPQAVCKAPSRGVFYHFGGKKHLVPEPNTNQIREALQFSRFRFKLIEFLKLPFDIGEPALRKVLERSCCGVYRNYLARAERVDEILKSEDTVELNVLVLPVTDHHRGDSPNM